MGNPWTKWRFIVYSWVLLGDFRSRSRNSWPLNLGSKIDELSTRQVEIVWNWGEKGRFWRHQSWTIACVFDGKVCLTATFSLRKCLAPGCRLCLVWLLSRKRRRGDPTRAFCLFEWLLECFSGLVETNESAVAEHRCDQFDSETQKPSQSGK